MVIGYCVRLGSGLLNYLNALIVAVMGLFKFGCFGVIRCCLRIDLMLRCCNCVFVGFGWLWFGGLVSFGCGLFSLTCLDDFGLGNLRLVLVADVRLEFVCFSGLVCAFKCLWCFGLLVFVIWDYAGRNFGIAVFCLCLICLFERCLLC